MNSYRDYTTLHEGFFKDIIDLVLSDDAFEKFWDKTQKVFKNKDTSCSKFNDAISKNIASAAKGLTAVFPVIA